MSNLDIINPESLGKPKGFSHGIMANSGRILFVAGQPGYVASANRSSAPSFQQQFAHALDRVIAVVQEAGGQPTDITRLTIFVTNLEAYLDSREALGEAWKQRFARYYPATTLVEVKGLVDEGAVVEIEATAMIGAGR
ncbi:MAG TPA: RidA family protein [Candidatus Eisenbacteria bacterium]|nr:RidA family protein [Candidatus Eisenbacteria bacterium]